jgi:hypothetical protein
VGSRPYGCPEEAVSSEEFEVAGKRYKIPPPQPPFSLEWQGTFDYPLYDGVLEGELITPRPESVSRNTLIKICEMLGFEANDVTQILLTPAGVEVVVLRRFDSDMVRLNKPLMEHIILDVTRLEM